VLGVIEKVPTANMEDALLVLPFKQVISLLEYLDIWAKTVRSLLVGFHSTSAMANYFRDNRTRTSH
jgi:hypothetical protein